MKEQVIVAFLAGGCIVLTAVSGLVYLKQDRTPPKIVVDTKEEVSYKDGDSYEALFKGVTAKDNRDGDLTDQIFIDRIISLNEKKAVVYYGVTDKANNVGTAKRKITYSEADSSDTEEADETGVEASETPVTSKNTDGASPILTLATQSKNIKTGSEFDPTSMVEDVSDDKDDKNTLYRHLYIDGTYDVSTAGRYELNYYVSDSDGNTSEPIVFTLVVQ